MNCDVLSLCSCGVNKSSLSLSSTSGRFLLRWRREVDSSSSSRTTPSTCSHCERSRRVDVLDTWRRLVMGIGSSIGVTVSGESRSANVGSNHQCRCTVLSGIGALERTKPAMSWPQGRPMTHFIEHKQWGGEIWLARFFEVSIHTQERWLRDETMQLCKKGDIDVM